MDQPINELNFIIAAFNFGQFFQHKTDSIHLYVASVGQAEDPRNQWRRLADSVQATAGLLEFVKSYAAAGECLGVHAPHYTG